MKSSCYLFDFLQRAKGVVISKAQNTHTELDGKPLPTIYM